MNRLRLLLLAAALLAALLAAYLSAGLLTREPAPPAPVVIQKNDTVDVLVTTKDLALGEQLGSLALGWRPWPRDGISAEMITKNALPDAIDQLQQARARLPMVAGEPIVAAKIVRPGDRGFMSAIVPSGMRAIAVPIGETTGVSGFILPNDRVDVLLTRQATGPNGEKTPLTQTVLTNVKVLAVNQSLSAANNDATIDGARTAVLELDPQQAEIMTNIVAAGTLTLVLRSLGEGGAGGVADGRPMTSEAFLHPPSAETGPLVIRYGLERTVPGR